MPPLLAPLLRLRRALLVALALATVASFSSFGAVASAADAPAATAILLQVNPGATPAPTVYGDTVNLHTTVTSGGQPVTEGWVSYWSGDTLLHREEPKGWYWGPGIISAQLRLPVGVHTITARYEGTAGFAASASETHTVTVGRAPVTMGVWAPNVEGTEPVRVQVGLAVRDPHVMTIAPTGTTILRRDGVEVARGSGPLTATFTDMKPGTYRFTAEFSGDSTYLPATAETTMEKWSIGGWELGFTTSVGGSSFDCPPGGAPFPACAASVTEGAPLRLQARLYPSNPNNQPAPGQGPTGSVEFYDGNRLLGSAPHTATGASLEVRTLAHGGHWLRAVYVGDGVYDAARSGSVPFYVRGGYWMLGAKGKVYAFGEAEALGDAPVGRTNAADIESTPSGRGYWVVGDQGHVFAFGDAAYLGGSGPLPRGEVVTSLSATGTGRGYWLFTNRGRVLAFGDAPFLGDMSRVPLNGPVLDSVPTPTDRGYYLVASDGGVFTFGDARFFGSMGGRPLNGPVRSLVPDADNEGYWLVASDGGIFSFRAPFYGSMGGRPLNRPVTGMVSAPDGRGYLMAASDGGVFTFGHVSFRGSLGAMPPSVPVVSVAVLG